MCHCLFLTLSSSNEESIDECQAEFHECACPALMDTYYCRSSDTLHLCVCSLLNGPSSCRSVTGHSCTCHSYTHDCLAHFHTCTCHRSVQQCRSFDHECTCQISVECRAKNLRHVCMCPGKCLACYSQHRCICPDSTGEPACTDKRNENCRSRVHPVNEFPSYPCGALAEV
jgi:hypothetical protein